MKKFTVQVEGDYIEKISKISPIKAIEQLIWNSLDADAKEVKIILNEKLGAIGSIVIQDNGNGIDSKGVESFKKLGGSWKKSETITPDGRRIHGRDGKGRFHIYTLGASAVWKSFTEDNGSIVERVIKCDSSDRRKITIGDPENSNIKRTGTSVRISNMHPSSNELLNDNAFQMLNKVFALYLKQYPDIIIHFNKKIIDPSSLVVFEKEIDLGEFTFENDEIVTAKLIIIEWILEFDRAIYLCDEENFAFHEIEPGIQAKGFNFTAYIKCKKFRELLMNNEIALSELNPNVMNIINNTKEKLRIYFRERRKQNKSDVIRAWKAERIYPYDPKPKNAIEQFERKVFDITAISISENLKEFNEFGNNGQKLALRLLKQTLQTKPGEIVTILKEVIELPSNKVTELSELIEIAGLETIITISNMIIFRMNFIEFLRKIIFEPASKEHLKERSQLHKIIEKNTWIFDDAYSLTGSDMQLERLCKEKSEKLWGIKDSTNNKNIDSKNIPDLLLSRVLMLPHADEKENLVIELKRPNVKIDEKAASQIKRYARAVANNELYEKSKTKWVFWALSNDMTRDVKADSEQKGRPKGILLEDEDGRITVWVKTWAELISDCQARLDFIQKDIEYSADNDDAFKSLKEKYKNFLPSEENNNQNR